MNKIRFQSAVSNARSRGERVIEAYNPKLGRRLQCFGKYVFGQWLRLEADPTFQAFCEHPAYLDQTGKGLVDFLYAAGRSGSVARHRHGGPAINGHDRRRRTGGLQYFFRRAGGGPYLDW